MSGSPQKRLRHSPRAPALLDRLMEALSRPSFFASPFESDYLSVREAATNGRKGNGGCHDDANLNELCLCVIVGLIGYRRGRRKETRLSGVT